MMLVQMTLLGYKNVLNVYLPLFSSPGMTISCLCHDAKRDGGGGRGGGGGGGGGGGPRRHNDAKFFEK